MGKIELDHTGSGGGITLSSDGTDLLVDGSAIGGGAANYTVTTKTASFTVTTSDLGKIFYVDPASSVTASLPAAATAGSGFYVTFTLDNNEATYKTLTIDPDGSETICGLSTYKIKPGMTLTTYSDGSNWFSLEDSNHMISTNSYGSKDQAEANGNRSLAIGDGAYSNNNYSTALGKSAQATGVNSIAIGATSGSVTASAASATAIGANSGSGASSATGNGAMALNGSYASGTNSLAAAIGNNSSSYGATGSYSVSIGYQSKATVQAVSIGTSTTASGLYGTAMGYQTTASGQYSVSLGRGGTASGNYATILGGYASTADANHSHVIGGFLSSTDSKQYATVIGPYGKAKAENSFTFGSNALASGIGNVQKSMYPLFADTTDATATVLTTDNSSAGSYNQVNVGSNFAVAFSGLIVAREQASGGTDCAAWEVKGLLVQASANSTVTLVNSAITVIDNTPGWTIALSADTTNGCLSITGTGAAATNIRWLATIETADLNYG